MQEEIEAAAYSFAKAVDDGEKVVVGVNRFTDAEEEPTEVFPIDVKLQQIQIDRTRSVRAERDQAAVDRALADVAETAKGEGNLLVPMKAALQGDGHAGRGVRRPAGRVRRLPARGLSRGVDRADIVLAPVRPRRPHATPGAAPAPRGRVRRARRAGRRGHPRPRDDALLRPVDRRRAAPSSAGSPRSGCGRHRANWSPDKWTFTGAAFVDGRPVGVQDVGAEHFRAVRSVETGSWLGRAHQGQGLGARCARRCCTSPSPALGAEEALSGAFEDNAASIATSRAVGYEENGEARGTAGTARAARSASG